jgi:hypothetical protein
METLTRFVARADPEGPGYRALFGMPGGYEDFVRDDDGNPREFETRAHAEFVAMRTLIGALNTRPRWTWRNRFRRMGPDEFAESLARANLSPSDFSRLWGTRLTRVQEWLSGTDTPPFPLPWILDLLARPGAAQRALALAAENTEFQQDRET